jgi:succinate dehydrogenase / fumarate reductase membrane anchor subunit
MAESYGSKRIVVGAHYGLMDWLSQRVAAVLMAAFTIILLVQVLIPGEIGYTRWAGMFATRWMKALSCVVIVAVPWHAWVGVRDIWMDYVKPAGVRLFLQVFSIVWLLGCAGWAIQMLWRL